MWLRLIVTFACLFVSTPIFAHGADQHVLGTIVAIDTTHVEIKTTKGQLVKVRFDKQTRFRDEGNPKGSNRPAVGDRVVVKAMKDDKKKVLIATDIHFSSARRAPAPIQQVPTQQAPAPPAPTQPAPAQ